MRKKTAVFFYIQYNRPPARTAAKCTKKHRDLCNRTFFNAESKYCVCWQKASKYQLKISISMLLVSVAV
ncbi:MAG: hypothetical protein GQF41_3991 [Candidatus Rifleibacterium amylolyticum]|nr:MAG: hypothetical protein GQF41_3991 [Candidatus Rifleibacterium amylolyticum]